MAPGRVARMRWINSENSTVAFQTNKILLLLSDLSIIERYTICWSQIYFCLQVILQILFEAVN